MVSNLKFPGFLSLFGELRGRASRLGPPREFIDTLPARGL